AFTVPGRPASELSRVATVSKAATSELAGRLVLPVLEADRLVLPVLEAGRLVPLLFEEIRMVPPAPTTGRSKVGAVGVVMGGNGADDGNVAMASLASVGGGGGSLPNSGETLVETRLKIGSSDGPRKAKINEYSVVNSPSKVPRRTVTAPTASDENVSTINVYL